VAAMGFPQAFPDTQYGNYKDRSSRAQCYNTHNDRDAQIQKKMLSPIKGVSMSSDGELTNFFKEELSFF
jgi:hypothetical protein